MASTVDIVNVRITHKTASLQLLEAVAFKDKTQAHSEIHSLDGVRECLLLQTCNRTELYLVSEDGDKTAKAGLSYLANRAGAAGLEASKAVECSLNGAALTHLLRTTAGLESLIVGEEQIINQVWGAYLEAEKAKIAGPILKDLFNRAINIGRRVRLETNISRGAISVGSAAVELAENLLQNLEDKKILVVGAGEMGTLVAKALARRCLHPIFIANRTYDHAVRLAEELGGKAVNFEELEVLTEADIVFCSTSAPHYLLTKELVAKLIVNRQNKDNLFIIDISHPSNVERAIEELPNVKLYNLDNLQSIAEQNKQKRMKSALEASKIIEKEVLTLEQAVKSESVDKIIAELLAQTEETRQRELTKALKMMSDLDERQKKIMADLTCTLLKQTFLPVVENLRQAAVKDEVALVELAVRLFDKKKACKEV